MFFIIYPLNGYFTIDSAPIYTIQDHPAFHFAVEDSPPLGGREIPRLLPVLIFYRIRKFVPRSGGKRAIFGYVRKNASVQEDINPSINIIYLTPSVNKNLTFYLSIFLKNDLEKVIDH